MLTNQQTIMSTALTRSRLPEGRQTPPGCVAQPPKLVPRYGRLVSRTAVYGSAYRGYDHRFCSHPTPLPAGYRRCAGDPGCEVRLPARGTRILCDLHADLAWNTPQHHTEQLMGTWVNNADGIA